MKLMLCWYLARIYN